jgi:hypothetical protein
MKMGRESTWGWGLATVAVVAGWWQWGWRGALLAVTLVAFWLLLQFSRALRVLRRAAGAPVGRVPSAVMLHARLRVGLPMAAVLPMAGSLGSKVHEQPETFEWVDASGAKVRAEFEAGRLERWSLLRLGDDGDAEAAAD